MTETVIKLLVSLTISIASLFIIDFLLPSEVSSEKVISKIFYHQQTSMYNSHMNYGIVTETVEIPTDADAVTYIKENDFITIKKTPILKTIVGIEHKNRLHTVFSIYNFYAVLPIIALLSGIWTRLMLTKKGDKYLSPLALHVISFLFLILFFVLNKYV